MALIDPWDPYPGGVSSIRIGLATINPTVGDLTGNRDLIVAATVAAKADGCQVVAFPEMAITGYPVEDLALRTSFRLASIAATKDLAAQLASVGCGDLWAIVGYLGQRDHRPTNSAAILRQGTVATTYDKHHLPNYGVFDEERWFAEGDTPSAFEVAGYRISVAICEDLWQEQAPALTDATGRSDLLIVINASPYEVAKQADREELCQRRARELGCPVAYVNILGGQDELVFDGGGLLASTTGELVMRSTRFAASTASFDLRSTKPGSAKPGSVADPESKLEPPLADLDAIYRALVLGLRDYVTKNGQRQVLLGLSGGIDSALVAAIACDSFEPDQVFGVSMPSRYSSSHSIADAVDLAQRTGLRLRTVPIDPMFTAFQNQLKLQGIAEENLQARIRGNILMAISNAEGQLVLATGNKSEVAVGYSTIYGDAVGGFAPLKDVPKTMVWELARHRNEQARSRDEVEPIPRRSIDKPPSAELRPGQLDIQSLPDYHLLDRILHGYVEQRQSATELVAAGFDPELIQRVIRLTDAAEYKRRQYPPGPKITALAFGRDRRLPITNHWHEPLE